MATLYNFQGGMQRGDHQTLANLSSFASLVAGSLFLPALVCLLAGPLVSVAARARPLALPSVRAVAADAHAADEIGAPPAEKRASRGRDSRDDPPPEPMSEAGLQRNAELVERLRGRLILAPLTKGGNLPFRRLCADFAAEVTVGEMGFARHLLKNDPREKALLRRAPNERLYGVQLATNQISEGVRAGVLAAEAGADWVDLNVGCPIYEATRRGLGSALLRKPAKLARLAAGIASQLPIPLTVKLRTSASSDGAINLAQNVAALADSGVAAITIHGRTAQQRYKKPADWAIIEEAVRASGIPIIGNGDILTHYEAARRQRDHGCLATMVGRGALIKPWIFQEVAEGRAIEPSAEERVGIYMRLVAHMKAHFGDDDKGRRKASYFLPFHLEFLCRYRPLPEAVFGELSLQQPLMSTRWEGVACAELGETLRSLGELERLLRCEAESAHLAIADALWEAAGEAEAVASLELLAGERLAEWEAEAVRSSGDGRGDDRDARESEG